MEKIYYLDNAATTKPFVEEIELMNECYNNFYNPSAKYRPAVAVRKIYENSREDVKLAVHGNNGKIIFTSSATESNNMVFEGVHLKSGSVVLISKAEHPAVYNAAHRLEKKGIIVKDIKIDEMGRVDFDDFKNQMSKEVALISIMHVSNDTGAINDIKKLCEYAKSINKKVIFHSDGVQAVGKIKVNILDLGIDLYTISGHKIYAPRGIAALWIKKDIIIDPLLIGGGQEEGMRSSTENVAGAVAFAYAIKRVCKEQQNNFEKVQKIKLNMLNLISKSSIYVNLVINSDEKTSPYILSISFKNIKGEILMNALVENNILISTGSACSSRYAGNRTLEAMGKTQNEIAGSIRISFSAYEDYDIEYITTKIIDNVLRFEKNI